MRRKLSEAFEEYKKRRKNARNEVKNKLKGTLAYRPVVNREGKKMPYQKVKKSTSI